MGRVANPRKPFEKIDVAVNTGGEFEVTAVLSAKRATQGSRAGLALNASDRIKLYYGISDTASDLYRPENEVAPTARRMVEILADFADNKVVDAIYWECGKESAEIERIGGLSMAEAGRTPFDGPSGIGMGLADTCSMLPALGYFQEGTLARAAWGVAVFVVDALIEDLAAVKEHGRQLAREIAAGEREFVKLVVIGVAQCLSEETGSEQLRQQLVELDDSLVGSGLKDPNGQEIDIWIHRMVDTMSEVGDAFADALKEMVAARDDVLLRTHKVYESGQVIDPKRQTVHKDYPDGVFGVLRFTLPAKTFSFALKCADGTFVQEIPRDAVDELVF